jgi:hypothetical protein
LMKQKMNCLLYKITTNNTRFGKIGILSCKCTKFENWKQKFFFDKKRNKQLIMVYPF